MKQFVEVQKMKQNRVAMVSMFLIPVALVGAIFAVNAQGPDPGGVLPMVIGLLVMIIVAVVYFLLNLTVSVDPDKLRIRFRPFTGEEIAYSEIESAEAVTYRPLRDYGGWGIRYGRGGRALNVSGDKGVQLVMKGGERLLLGSLRPMELAAAIKERIAALPRPE